MSAFEADRFNHSRTSPESSRWTQSSVFGGQQNQLVYSSVAAECGTGFAQGDHFGVGSGIVIGKIAIATAADDLAPARDHCAYRDFSGFQRALGGAESFFHEEFVGVGFMVGWKHVGWKRVH